MPLFVSEEQKEESLRALNVGIREFYDPNSSICGDFGWALRQMKEGKMVCRAAWQTGSCIFLITGRNIEYNKFQSFKNNACQAFNPPEDIEIEDHIDGRHNGKYITGIVLSQADLLAEDWELYEEEK